jgi:pimeloyl-ACP methyl ester carboxylesterase
MGFSNRLAGGLLLSGSVALGGWVVWSRCCVNHKMTLQPAVEAECKTLTTPETGMMSYYVDTRAEGVPLVLIHSINAAPSAYEVKPLFEAYRSQRPVYALELPGFGFSERSDRPYSPTFYAEAIRTFVREVVGEAADVVALSLSAEFAAIAALEDPDLFRSLVAISPTGLNKGEMGAPAEGLYNVVAFPLWSQPLFDLLVTRPSMRFFLGKTFAGAVPPGFLEYAHASAHQPGARYAPLRFIAGQLFTRRVRQTVYEKVNVPSLILYGSDPFVSFETLPDLLQANPRWRAEFMGEKILLPHWETPQATYDALAQFWGSLS